MPVKEKIYPSEKATPLAEQIDFTSDWPIEELRKELSKRELGEDSSVSSVKDFEVWCDRNPR